jgi:hypothetical protein
MSFIRPRVFIGSSSKALGLAEKFATALSGGAETVVWNDAPEWRTMWSTLDGLFEVVEGYDFGLFVFAPDDDEVKGGQKLKAVRDNVILELGLFLGALGRDRTFAVMWEPVASGKKSHIRRDSFIRTPTDLLGITIPRFRGTGPALGRSIKDAARELNLRINEQGRRENRLDLNQGWGYDFSTREFFVVIPQESLLPRKRLKGQSLLLAARVRQDSVVGEVDPNLALGAALRVPIHVRQEMTLLAGGRAFKRVTRGDIIEGYLFVVPQRFRIPPKPTVARLVKAGGDLIATMAAKAKDDTR